MTDGVVKISVSKVLDEDALVPFSTLEVQFVRQAKNIFIAWPRHLVRLVSQEVFA